MGACSVCGKEILWGFLSFVDHTTVCTSFLYLIFWMVELNRMFGWNPVPLLYDLEFRQLTLSIYLQLKRNAATERPFCVWIGSVFQTHESAMAWLTVIWEMMKKIVYYPTHVRNVGKRDIHRVECIKSVRKYCQPNVQIYKPINYLFLFM